MEKIILIKYGELTTKKSNRNLFINTLYQNINKSLEDFDYNIEKNRDRMIIYADSSVIDSIVLKLKKIFGIHGIVIAYKFKNNIDDIKSNVLDICKDIQFSTFKVETKRSDKSFPVKSMEFNNIIGGLILKNFSNVKVDVHNPEFNLKIEIGNIGVSPFPNPASVASKKFLITILPSGDTSVPKLTDENGT